MVYALHNFIHYLLVSHFNMYTYHYALIYLGNKLVLGGIICRWILLFQQYKFELIVKPKKFNLGLDHLSWILSGEYVGNLDDNLPNTHLFLVQMVNDYFAYIVQLLSIGLTPPDFVIA
jgi:hypothetical protein